MAEEGTMHGSRELDNTPTWAVALVCGIIVIISIIIEKVIHKIGVTFARNKKHALLEALEKIKSELMVLGFISLILVFGQTYITQICIPVKIANTMLPCALKHRHHNHRPGGGAGKENHRRMLLWYESRILATDSPLEGCPKGHMPLISEHGLHQLHIFIFFLAIFHVAYSATTMILGRMKIREWKQWERDVEMEAEASNGPSRFRLTHETSFVKSHTASSWIATNSVFFYIGCFFRHIFRSVRRADYLTLRHGFISVHLAPGTKFNFQQYIKRSLEDDFKLIVGIPPMLWTAAVIFLLLNVKGWQTMFWLSIMPLAIILAVGTKLQAIISRMAIEIKERHAVVQGIPLVQLSDKHFWFSWPELVLHLIHLTLFQNAFEITYFMWITYEFGLHSCFNSHFALAVTRVCIGVGAQFLCSYITLPLYALVAQMGSHMKRSIFDDQTSKALLNWHNKARKKSVSRNGPHAARIRRLGSMNSESSLEGSARRSLDGSLLGLLRASPSTKATIGLSIEMADKKEMFEDINDSTPETSPSTDNAPRNDQSGTGENKTPAEFKDLMS